MESFGALLRAALPARLFVKVGRDISIFNDCDFSGLRTWFNPGVARFYRCHFFGVEVRGALLQAHFVDCDFSGSWEANFTSEAPPEDPASRVNVSGNDFRGLRDMDFFGVPRDANLFDTAGAHLIVRRSHLADPAVMHTLRTTPDGASVFQRLQLGQEDWVLMQQGSSLTASDWDALQAVIPRD